MINANRIPKATVSSNREEIEPLIDFGDTSARYSGTVVDNNPIASPERILPHTIIQISSEDA
jgi:hypothetical protein